MTSKKTMEDKNKSCRETQEEFWKGLNAFFDYIPSGITAIDWLKPQIESAAQALEMGEVRVSDHTFWAPAFYILNAQTQYLYIEYDDDSDLKPGEIRPGEDIRFFVDKIPEHKDCKVIKDLALRYLFAGAALAHKIGSDTYQVFRQLIVAINFGNMPKLEDFRKSLVEALKLLWADNEVYSGNRFLGRAGRECGII